MYVDHQAKLAITLLVVSNIMFSTRPTDRAERRERWNKQTRSVSQLRTVGESFSLSAGPDERPRIGGETGEWSEQRARAASGDSALPESRPGESGVAGPGAGPGGGQDGYGGTGYGEERRGARVPHVREVY